MQAISSQRVLYMTVAYVVFTEALSLNCNTVGCLTLRYKYTELHHLVH